MTKHIKAGDIPRLERIFRVCDTEFISSTKSIISQNGSITVEGTALAVEKNVPLILDGNIQTYHAGWLYKTPLGILPRVDDVILLHGICLRTLANRLSISPVDWYVISKPTRIQKEKAMLNVNDLYTEYHSKRDHCEICNALDDQLFKEHCWLVDTAHECGDSSVIDVTFNFTYSYLGTDYTVTIDQWLEGLSLHLPKGQAND